MEKGKQPIKNYPSKKGYFTTYDGGYVNKAIVKTEVADLFNEGATNTEIKNALSEKYNISKSGIEGMIVALNKELLALKDKKLMEACAKNVSILQKVVSECMKAKRYKEVISAVAELNKMSGLLPDQTIVVNNYGFQFGTEAVEIQEAKIVEPINNETGLE